jgi:hypothetical protein
MLAKYVESGGKTRAWLAGRATGQSLRRAPAISPALQSTLARSSAQN